MKIDDINVESIIFGVMEKNSDILMTFNCTAKVRGWEVDMYYFLINSFRGKLA